MERAAETHYETLGVSRTADDRTIKKAYFRLVRRHPPDLAPREFQRVRAAYEVLADSEARRRYDAQAVLVDDELAVCLREGDAALARHDHRLARMHLRRALELAPDSAAAAERLAEAELDGERPREALLVLETLARGEPSRARTLVLLARAHTALGDSASARAALERALAIDPASAAVLAALADRDLADGRPIEALARIDEALRRATGDEQRADLIVQRLRVILLALPVGREHSAAIDAALSALPVDASIDRAVATHLWSLGAELLRLGRTRDAEDVLDAAARLARVPRVPRFAPEIRARLVDLPRAAVDKLRALARDPASATVQRGAWAVPLCGVLLALALLGGGLIDVLDGGAPWKRGPATFAFLLLVGGATLLAAAGMRLARASRSALGRLTTLTARHLVEIDLDRLSAWPLVQLRSVSLSHHMQSGAYQHSTVRLAFARRVVSVRVRGGQRAVEWARTVVEARDRLLGVIAIGALADDEEDLLAGELPPRSPAQRSKWRARVIVAVTAAASSAAFVFVAAPAHRSLVDQGAWRRVLRAAGGDPTDRMRAERRYLVEHPEGQHADDARDSLDAEYGRVRRRYLAHSAGAPGAIAMASIVERLRAADQPEREQDVRATHPLLVSTHGQVTLARALPSLDVKPLVDGERALDEEMRAALAERLVTDLGTSLAPRLPPHILELSLTPDAAPVGELRIEYEVHSSKERARLAVLDGGGIAHGWFSGLVLSFDVTLSVEGRSLHELHVEVVAEPRAPWIEDADLYFGDDTLGPAALYRDMASSAFAQLGELLARDLGIEWLPAPTARTRWARMRGVLTTRAPTRHVLR